VIGKPLGTTIAALAAVRLRLAALPEGVSWTALHGCAWLGGIGFTMSLFIATLAFTGTTFARLSESRNSGRLDSSRHRRSDRAANRRTKPKNGLKIC
jgi:Na+/H+ antiporter NhaA